MVSGICFKLLLPQSRIGETGEGRCTLIQQDWLQVHSCYSYWKLPNTRQFHWVPSRNMGIHYNFLPTFVYSKLSVTQKLKILYLNTCITPEAKPFLSLALLSP